MSSDYRRYRAAMSSEARPLVLALEQGGFRLRLQGGRLQVAPSARLTAEDRQALRKHAADVKVLIEHRGAWYDWSSRPAPAFDPSRAFLTPDEIRRRAS